MSVERTFRSPSGRTWTARVVELPNAVPAAVPVSVLRFQSDHVVFDVARWPHDWHALDDDALVELLRAGKPPALGLPGERSLDERG